MRRRVPLVASVATLLVGIVLVVVAEVRLGQIDSRYTLRVGEQIYSQVAYSHQPWLAVSTVGLLTIAIALVALLSLGVRWALFHSRL